MIQQNQYGTADIQNELLDIMKIFHNFCVEHEIVYFLYGGSCLGAVRHKGFIPWDDDLDICVDRNNYIKLTSVISECTELNMHKTIWVNRIQKTTSQSIKGLIPTLDVFVIDNAPDNSFRFKFKNFRLAMLQGMLKEEISYKRFTPIYRSFLFTTHILGKLFSVNTLRKWYDDVSAVGNETHTKEIHCTNTSYRWIRNKFPSDTWDEAILVDFEDAHFYIPKHYDSYLKVCYGDYMKLPDEIDRVPKHVHEFQ